MKLNKYNYSDDQVFLINNLKYNFDLNTIIDV